MAPAGLGVLLGTWLLGRLSTHINKQRLVQFGSLAMGAGLFIMAWLDFVAQKVSIGVGLIPAVMVLMVFFGVEYAFVTVPSQTILMERAPVSSRGRIFAVQIMMGNLATVIPLVFIGGLADLFGIRQVIAFVGICTALLGWLAIRYEPAASGQPDQSTGSP